MSLTSSVVFFGTPPFAVESLHFLLNSGRNVKLVVSQPDRPAGRGLKLNMSAVKQTAVQHGIPVLQPKKLKDPQFAEQLQSVDAKIFVVAAYGRIIPKTILEIPTHTLNIHASLLPRWRGAAPIERAILAGDTVTGVCIMRLVEELDAGDLLLSRTTPIGENETAGELRQRLANLGAELLIEALDHLDRSQAKFVPQDGTKVTLAPPILASEGHIDWNRSTLDIHNLVRAMNPHPGAFTRDRKHVMKIHRTARSSRSCAGTKPGTVEAVEGKLFVACANEWIEILDLQREGKTRQAAKNFLSGYHRDASTVWD